MFYPYFTSKLRPNCQSALSLLAKGDVGVIAYAQHGFFLMLASTGRTHTRKTARLRQTRTDKGADLFEPRDPRRISRGGSSSEAIAVALSANRLLRTSPYFVLCRCLSALWCLIGSQGSCYLFHGFPPAWERRYAVAFCMGRLAHARRTVESKGMRRSLS